MSIVLTTADLCWLIGGTLLIGAALWFSIRIERQMLERQPKRTLPRSSTRRKRGF